jgi:hypothetical protein
MIAKANGTFSADVKLHLYVDDEKFEIGQLGPDFAIFREPKTIHASHGELETVIDGMSSRWKIRFTSPPASESRKFTFESVKPNEIA